MLKVFIADDSEIVRDRLKELFKDKGTLDVVGAAGDAEQAIPAIRRLKPDVVILDIRMPGGGGMPVLMDIRASQPGCVVVVLTSYAQPQYRQAYLTAGADYFFDKTRDIQKMCEVLAELACQHAGASDEQPPTGGLETNPGVHAG